MYKKGVLLLNFVTDYYLDCFQQNIQFLLRYSGYDIYFDYPHYLEYKFESIYNYKYEIPIFESELNSLGYKVEKKEYVNLGEAAKNIVVGLKQFKFILLKTNIKDLSWSSYVGESDDKHWILLYRKKDDIYVVDNYFQKKLKYEEKIENLLENLRPTVSNRYIFYVISIPFEENSKNGIELMQMMFKDLEKYKLAFKNNMQNLENYILSMNVSNLEHNGETFYLILDEISNFRMQYHIYIRNKGFYDLAQYVANSYQKWSVLKNIILREITGDVIHYKVFKRISKAWKEIYTSEKILFEEAERLISEEKDDKKRYYS